jgi:hypothetical protein
MTDYHAKIIGQFAGGIRWTTGVHITSNQSESALATTWNNAVGAMWTDPAHGIETLYPVTTSVVETMVTTLDGSMRGVSQTVTGLAVPGTSTADTLPYQEAIVISLRGVGIKRHNRGRMFLPALAEDQVNSDALITAAQTRISTAIKAVWSTVNSDGSTFFVTNLKPLKDGTPAFQKSVVTTPLVSNKPARQSRRVAKIAPSYM